MSAPLPLEDLMEDLEFLDSTQVGATDAAKRTGFPTPHALEKWLERHDRYDLWLRMKHRDPVGAHEKTARRHMNGTVTQIDTLAAVLAEAEQSSRARTRNRAQKVREMVEDLRTVVATEREDDKRRESARKEVERLEKALREAKAKMRGGSVTLDVDSSVSAAELRAWAKDNGIDCPPMGRVPNVVREQYEAAQDEASA